MRVSQLSSLAWGRASSAGNEPISPVAHCAITSSGFETMNMGAQITGMRS